MCVSPKAVDLEKDWDDVNSEIEVGEIEVGEMEVGERDVRKVIFFRYWKVMFFRFQSSAKPIRCVLVKPSIRLERRGLLARDQCRLSTVAVLVRLSLCPLGLS